MCGKKTDQNQIFSYVSLEERISQRHPLRKIRKIVDTALAEMSDIFDDMYAAGGRPSAPPEQLIGAMLIQVLFSIRSERLLMEELDFNLLFRWYVGLSIDDSVGNHSVFSKNRDRLLLHDAADRYLWSSETRLRQRGCFPATTGIADGDAAIDMVSRLPVKPEAAKDG